MPIVSAESFERGDGLAGFGFGSSRACDAPIVIDFLNALSKRLLRDQGSRAYPDLVTFGYFCRKSNTSRALAALLGPQQRFGWGTAIHIPPSNIPVNFGFSWVMAFLAGNSSIVRLPSRIVAQTELLIGAVDAVLQEASFAPLAASIAFVQTERDSPRLDALIAEAQALLVWGGDATVTDFRARPKRPGCVALYFPDRVSSALIDAPAYLALSEEQRDDLARAFFNDSFLVDQNACSSPSLVFWTGDLSDVRCAQRTFWNRLSDRIGEGYALDPVARIDKMLNVMHVSESLRRAFEIDRSRPDVWLSTDAALREMPLRFGTFVEIQVPDAGGIAPYLRQNEQTLTVFGKKPGDVFDALKPTGCKVDRIVPVGRALDIGLHWDGKDTLSTLSRQVQVG